MKGAHVLLGILLTPIVCTTLQTMDLKIETLEDSIHSLDYEINNFNQRIKKINFELTTLQTKSAQLQKKLNKSYNKNDRYTLQQQLGNHQWSIFSLEEDRRELKEEKTILIEDKQTFTDFLAEIHKFVAKRQKQRKKRLKIKKQKRRQKKLRVKTLTPTSYSEKTEGSVYEMIKQ